MCRGQEKHVKSARDALKRYDTRFWSDKVLLYLDSVSYVYKSNFQDVYCPPICVIFDIGMERCELP